MCKIWDPEEVSMTTPDTTRPEGAPIILESAKTADGQSSQQAAVEADWPTAAPAVKHDRRAEALEPNTEFHTKGSESIVLDWE